PLVSMQLLWINLVTDSLPAIALGTEPVEKDVMDRKPKPKNESIFAHKLGLKVALQGVMFAVLTLSGFYLGQTLGGSLEAARTMAFVVLALCQLVQAYNMRSEHSLFAIGFFGNKRLNWSVLISLLLVCLVVFVPPLASAFALTMLDWWMYLIALGLALIPLPVMEIAKAVGLGRHQKDAK
ncbi:MAG: cation transporting ATPase C-terminal domain-containing protein, partial [Oscillospiraceae bacterium]|nr:cation transporting ATPase C-terminal domain-containing protein [Oscillospiraceae bacterium]